MIDVSGRALHDYYHRQSKHKLWIHNKYGTREEMPVAVYFRDEDDMPDLEWLALQQCHGRVLDIGAGAGSHSLLLQYRNFDVTAIDLSPLSVQVMKDRGVLQAFEADIFSYNQGRFDTLLMLMNGIGLAGTLSELKRLLAHLKVLLNEGGQILFDSSDVAYLYDDGKFPEDHYYGEICYRYEYRKQITHWFKWLYIDEKTLHHIAAEAGFKMEVLLEDEFGQYLGRLTKK